MKKTRICIIGGGSRLWAIQFIKDLAYFTMTHGELVLYDIDQEAAQRNVAVAHRIFSVNDSKGRFAVFSVNELGEALSGCDLVIISIEPGKTECRYSDLVIPEGYGILQTVGDTTGPGGIMRARRALPLFFDFAKMIEKYCPDAWVINYTNPLTLCTAALFQAFPRIKALGCCHEVFHTQNYLAQKVAAWFSVPVPDRRDIHIDITGVNHFTFVTKATWQCHDLMCLMTEHASDPTTFSDRTDAAITRLKEESWFESDFLVALSFLRDFGALGAAGDRHLAEFVPWFLPSDKTLHRYGVIRTPYEWRIRQAKEKRERQYDESDLFAKRSDEEGVDIMRCLMGDMSMITNINRPNEGQITYLPAGRIVETNGFIEQDTIRPIMSTDPPQGIQTLIRRVSDIQHMVLQAIWANDEQLLFTAFLSDPLMNISRDKARQLFDRMLVSSALSY